MKLKERGELQLRDSGKILRKVYETNLKFKREHWEILKRLKSKNVVLSKEWCV